MVFIGEGHFTVKFNFTAESPAKCIVTPHSIGHVHQKNEVQVVGQAMNVTITLFDP